VASGRIIVSAERLEADRETRRYLVAHELGHLARKHSERVLGSVIITVAIGILILAAPNLRRHFYLSLKIVIATAFFASGGFLLWTLWGYNTEYEADAVATGLINKQAVIKGICDMAPIEGGMTFGILNWPTMAV
jgi:Zn-dependent protease with chaperone function